MGETDTKQLDDNAYAEVLYALAAEQDVRKIISWGHGTAYSGINYPDAVQSTILEMIQSRPLDHLLRDEFIRIARHHVSIMTRESVKAILLRTESRRDRQKPTYDYPQEFLNHLSKGTRKMIQLLQEGYDPPTVAKYTGRTLNSVRARISQLRHEYEKWQTRIPYDEEVEKNLHKDRPEWAEVYNLHYKQCMRVSDIAVSIGKTPDCVSVSLNAIRKRLPYGGLPAPSGTHGIRIRAPKKST